MAFKALGWEVRIRIVISWTSLRYARGHGGVGLDHACSYLINAEQILSFGSMMLLAQALEALWDRSNESIQNYKHERK